MKNPFVRAGLFVVMLLGLALFIWSLTISDSLRHKLFLSCGGALFFTSLSVLGHKGPGEDYTWSIAVSGISAPLIIVLIALVPFLHENWLARRCKGPKEHGAFEACQEILRSGQEILQRRGTRKLSPVDKSKILNSMGSAYYHTEQYDLAIANYSSAIASNPGNVQAYMNRCGAFLAKRDVLAALKDCEDAVRIAPYSLSAYLLRANAYAANRQYEDALRDFGHSLSLQPKNTLALNGRCETYNILGQTGPALADCNSALALSPKDADTLDTRGFVYLKAGNYAAARADFDAAIGLDARQAASFYGRALIERQEGDTAGADADIAQAVNMKPDVADEIALYGLGR